MGNANFGTGKLMRVLNREVVTAWHHIPRNSWEHLKTELPDWLTKLLRLSEPKFIKVPSITHVEYWEQSEKGNVTIEISQRDKPQPPTTETKVAQTADTFMRGKMLVQQQTTEVFEVSEKLVNVDQLQEREYNIDREESTAAAQRETQRW